MAAVVLVHGLYHCPGHFAVVAERLQTAGTEVVVPELHRGSLSADTVAVQAAIDALQEPPVVLGHSYGGSVITGVHGAGHLVYLAPSTYVVCAQDRAIDPGLQRTMASRCTDVREWQTGHSPFVGRPDLIVDLVQDLLATTTPALR